MDWVKKGRRKRWTDPSIPTLIIYASFLTALLVDGADVSSSQTSFVFNGFAGVDLRLNGGGEIEPSGILRLTNYTRNEVGHAFYPTPIVFLNSTSGKAFSFSTSFVFVILPQYDDISSQGIAFVIAPTNNLTAVLPSQHLGLFNLTNNGDSDNRIVAVELDTIQNSEFLDINDNHVGIDVNGLISISSAPASFFMDSSGLHFQNLSLIGRQPLRVWAEYDGETMVLNVTLAPLSVSKPQRPLLSSKLNLSSIILQEMYAGFAASTGTASGSHYIMGWSFGMNGAEKELNLSDLPSLPLIEELEDADPSSRKDKFLVILLPTAILLVLLTLAMGTLLLLKVKKKFAEVMEDWETEYGPHRFSYRDLYRSTKGFRDENLLGSGGFGVVYKGKLSKSNLEIAVKRISHDSRQGMKEFVAEIASLGRLRHRNLVQLLGYCRRRGELLLVYEFMPNSSLDKYIFDRPNEPLNWSQRFKIIRGIASGLLYLHEEWEQIVIHRDIKACNVLLDGEFNGKLGDFGLARLHDRGCNLQTTRVVGTFGYLAPELSRTGKSTTCSDVFGFGAFLLEVACGKRPIELRTSGIDAVLVDCVLSALKRGEILEVRDRKLGTEFAAEEVEMVLRLGLMCSHPSPAGRPTMRQVVQYLEGEVPIPNLSEDDFYIFDSSSRRNRILVDVSSSNSCIAPAYPSSSSSG